MKLRTIHHTPIKVPGMSTHLMRGSLDANDKTTLTLTEHGVRVDYTFTKGVRETSETLILPMHMIHAMWPADGEITTEKPKRNRRPREEQTDGNG